MFIMCSILATNLDFFSQEVTAKAPPNKLTVRESGNLVLQQRLCILLKPIFIQSTRTGMEIIKYWKIIFFS